MINDERIEKDSLGAVPVPAKAYYGAQTARAMVNFPISGILLSDNPVLINALAYVKKATAKANGELELISDEKAKIIMQVCDEIISGKLHDQFPIDMFQGGAGTSTNMNINEVIANRGLEIMGHARGDYNHLHPNNDVNCSQSTNDVYPTALRLSVLFSHDKLYNALDNLAASFEQKGREFNPILKLGRTQLQDAVPMTLGQEFHAFATTIREDCKRLKEIVTLFHEINLGGTAIGTGINSLPQYREQAVHALSGFTNLPLVPSSDLVEASWDTGAFVLFSGMLKRVASKLSKVCNDLRLLSSGPRGGLNEINLPPMQPGSSIMPGKVNPVIPEVVNQVCFQVIGNDLAITMAAEAGQLQLNVMEPVILFNMLNSMTWLTNVVDVLREKCINGITANEAYCLSHLNASTAIITALSPKIGYEQAAALAKEVLSSGKSTQEVLANHSEIPEEALKDIADLHSLIAPHA